VARTVGSAADQTRQRILATASQLFVEHGYAATSVRDISQRLGMTKGSLYYHFASKEDLLVALLAPLFEAVDGFVAAAREGGEVTADLVRRLIDLLDEHAPMLRSFLADPSVEQVKTQARHHMPARFAQLLEILGGGPDGGSLLRARCALGVIHAGVLAPRLEAGQCAGEQAGWRARLSDVEKSFVVDATMAVLSVPVRSPGVKVDRSA
jgi:AcrR family transcriptional regulator